MRGAERTTERRRNELAEIPHRIAESEISGAQHKRVEETYRVVVEQSLQGLIIIQEFRIVFANTAFAEISGYALEELPSLSPEEVMALIHPEDQELVWGRFRDRFSGSLWVHKRRNKSSEGSRNVC